MPAGVHGRSAHLCVRRAHSFCCMSCKRENYISGTLIQSFFFSLKRCKIECMFTCPRSKVLNTRVTISWMGPPLGALLSSGNRSCCPFSPTFTVTAVGFWCFHFRENYVQNNNNKKKWKAIKRSSHNMSAGRPSSPGFNAFIRQTTSVWNTFMVECVSEKTKSCGKMKRCLKGCVCKMVTDE